MLMSLFYTYHFHTCTFDNELRHILYSEGDNSEEAVYIQHLEMKEWKALDVCEKTKI